MGGGRAGKALLNTASSLLVQLASVVCGFVVPIAYIGAFGSETYGAIGTITQYLGFIALLEGGVGGVTRAALYGPLARGDVGAVSSIVRATERFFRGIGGAFAAYALVVACVFPFVTHFTGEWALSFALTMVIAAGTLAQYMFGITYSVLLQADQRVYVANAFQVATSVANAAVVVAMVGCGAGVVAVQAASSALYVLRPVVLGAYVRRRYRLSRDAEPDRSAIADRWSGLGHHLAFYLRSNVSAVALSAFAPLAEVSVFTVYNLVAQGLQRLVNAFSSGVEAAFGNMIAKGESEALARNFRLYERLSSTLVVVVFSTALATVLPFMSVYTAGVGDADYRRPALALLLLSASALYCFRLPYNSVVLAAGHYRQTRNGAFAEAGISVGLSFALAGLLGAEGVAAALLAATAFRTAQYGWYASRHILGRGLSHFVGQCAFVVCGTAVCTAAGLGLASLIEVGGYPSWFALAAAVFVCSALIVSVFEFAFWREDLRAIARKLRSVLNRG